jgi:putative spermidine/putrescine transport system substrate-binding protein
MISRHAVLTCLILAGVLASEPALANEKPRLDGVVLRVATWGGSWRDNLREFVGKALEERGATVEYIVGTPQEHLAKLIAARGQSTTPFDVVEISDNNTRDWLKSNFLADIDYTKIPNAAALDPRFRQKHLVSTSQTQDGIAWNTEKFREAGVAAPKTYADLMNPKLKGFVAFPTISLVHAIKALSAVSHELGGDESNVDPALDFVRKMEVQLYWRSSVDLLAKFKSGDIWAAPWHVGWVVRGREAGVPLAMAWPEIGSKRGIASVVWAGIVERTKQQEAAAAFLNHYLEAEPQFLFAKASGVVPQSADAAAKLAETPALKATLLLSPEQREALYYPRFDEIDVRDWTNRWNRKVLH